MTTSFNWQIDHLPFAGPLQAALAKAEAKGHGDLSRWQAALAQLPEVDDCQHQFSPLLKISGKTSPEQLLQLKQALLPLHPWRKGPFQLFDHYIDTEWRCDWKWQRVLPHIESLAGRRVLDVGCGNGYYLWRMLGEGVVLTEESAAPKRKSEEGAGSRTRERPLNVTWRHKSHRKLRTRPT